MKILVVEDEYNLADAIKTRLEKEKYIVDIAKDGANVTLKNITIETSATGANGVFSYGGSATTENTASDNITIAISDSTINTTKDNSGGIMTTDGGIMKASNLTINTAGTSSVVIRTDRGGEQLLLMEELIQQQVQVHQPFIQQLISQYQMLL